MSLVSYFAAEAEFAGRDFSDAGRYEDVTDANGRRQSRLGAFRLRARRSLARGGTAWQSGEGTFRNGSNEQNGATTRRGARGGYETEQRKVRYDAFGSYEQQGPLYVAWNVAFVVPEAVRQRSTTQWEAFEQLRKGRTDPAHGGPASLQKIRWEFTAPQQRSSLVRAEHRGLGSRTRPRGNEQPLPAHVQGHFNSKHQEQESWQYEAWTIEAAGLQSAQHELPTALAVVG